MSTELYSLAALIIMRHERSSQSQPNNEPNVLLTMSTAIELRSVAFFRVHEEKCLLLILLLPPLPQRHV